MLTLGPLVVSLGQCRQNKQQALSVAKRSKVSDSIVVSKRQSIIILRSETRTMRPETERHVMRVR